MLIPIEKIIETPSFPIIWDELTAPFSNMPINIWNINKPNTSENVLSYIKNDFLSSGKVCVLGIIIALLNIARGVE